MPIPAGSRLGRYEITAPVGAGGMGEVYRARDGKLNREVAIKVLPAAFANDEDRLRRFEQEALATAALNHPNILVVYDVGRDAETAYVVEELLEGRTLRDLAAERALPVRRIVDYGVQVAAGLAAAHEKGIVHRDLKPENLFVTTDERVKILDFGLAKQLPASTRGTSDSRTALAGTEPGLVLGTIGYMAPEQVRGLAVDHRSDIFSFGAVMYELLSGQRAFTGEMPADTMTAILKDAPPDLIATGRMIPLALARLVDRCLEKSPAARFQSASDLAFALRTLASETPSGPTSAPSLAEAPAARGARLWLVSAGSLVAGAAIALGLWSQLRPAPAPPVVMSFDVAPPPGASVAESALSPDGTRVVFVATTSEEDRRGRLFLRTIESGALHALAGTEGARYPFWSPDSDAIAFSSEGHLRVLELSRGRVRIVCNLSGGRVTGGTWNQQGVILFSSPGNVPIARVSVEGNAPPVPLPGIFGEAPAFLPDGRHFVYSGSTTTASGLHLGDIESGTTTDLRPDGRRPKYAAGHLLFGLDERLVAQPFDLNTRTLSGEATALAEIGPALGFISASDRLAVYTRIVDAGEHLVWYSRDGARLDTIDADGDWYNPELSPDDGSVAAQRNEFQGNGPDIWIHDARRGSNRALASERQSELMPFWSRDGARVWFVRDNVVFEKPSSGGAERRVSDTAAESTLRVTGISQDDRYLVAFRMNNQNNRDIVIVPLAAGQRPFPFAASPANEMQPALSPDGRWLAYVTDELGPNLQRTDVFVQAFPDGGHKVRVSASTDGGAQPRWRKDGRELFFVANDQQLMALAVEQSGEVLRLGPPRPLFKTPVGPVAGLATRAGYDVTRDGRRFIIVEPRPGGRTSFVAVVVNWTVALRERR